MDGTPSTYKTERPFLFPLIVAVLNKIGGPHFIWLFQMSALVIGNLFLYKASHLMFRNVLISVLASLIYFSNFSLNAISFHALTEPITVCGVAVLVYIGTKRYLGLIDKHSFWSWTLLVLGLLVVIKPVFTIPFFLSLLLLVIHILRKKVFVKDLRRIALSVGIGVVLFQMILMRIHSGEFGISQIGEKTLKNYLIAQTIAETENITRQDALDYVADMEVSDVRETISQHPGTVFQLFTQNLLDNVQADSYLENYRIEENDKIQADFMRTYNSNILFLLCFIVVAGLVQLLMKFKTLGHEQFAVYFLLILLLYLTLVTGVAFDQRDRLMLPALPLWIFLWFFYLKEFRNLVMWSLKKIKDGIDAKKKDA